MKITFSKMKKFIKTDGVSAVSVFIVILAFMGGTLAFQLHARAAQSGTYSLDRTYDAFSTDTWSGSSPNTSTCGNFNWCGPGYVGVQCQTQTYYPTYQSGGQSTGNVETQIFTCDFTPSAPQCVAYQGQSCASTATNSCGTPSYGTYNCDGSCSATAAPANPAGYGTACTAQTSCSDGSTLTSSGTIQCNGSCSATPPSSSLCPSSPSCVANQGSACNSLPNACGTRNSGTVQCDGSCSASAPANPAGYGNPCSSSPNSCNMTNSGTVQCDGSCSATTPPNSQCTSGSGSCTDTGPVTLQVSPSVVPSGTASSVTFTWTVSNASASCTLTGPGVNAQTGTPTSCSINGNAQESVTVSSPSTYTLTCPGGQSATAIVRTVPQIREF